MNAVENQVRELVKVELAAANERFPQFHSAHEGYAVIKEEIEETAEEIAHCNVLLDDLWDSIRDNISFRSVGDIKESAIQAAVEAIQVAAMAQKFLEMENCEKG